MNDFLKTAHDIGANQAREDVYKTAHDIGVERALLDFGIVKQADEGVTAGDVAKGLGIGLGAGAGGVVGAGSGLMYNLGQGLSAMPGKENFYQKMLLSGSPDTRLGRALGNVKAFGLPAGLALGGALAGGGLLSKALESEEEQSILDSLRERMSPKDNTGAGAIAAGGLGGALGAGAGAIGAQQGAGQLYYKMLAKNPNAKTRAAATLLGAMGLGAAAGGYGGYQGAKSLVE